MRRLFVLLLPLVAVNLMADATPYSVASLVQVNEEAALADPLTEAFRSPTALVRATAARVVSVRGLEQFLPLLREAVGGEGDVIAAREEIRALALLGNDEDLALAVKAASRWPSGMDNALAVAVARRGGVAAVQGYLSTLRKTRMTNVAEVFRTALWGHVDAVTYAASRVLGEGDEAGWKGLLGALAESDTAMNGGVLASSLASGSEEIRSASVWFLVRGYANDPASMNEAVKNKIAEERAELSSDREDFGVELLRRMLGRERTDDARWLKFLESKEADGLLAGESAALQYLTDAEYAVRYDRCEVQSRDCAMPPKRGSRTIPSQPVGPPVFNLPEVLPAGLTDAIMNGAGCRGEWLGVATASVDSAGRVTTLDLAPVTTSNSCRRAVDLLLRLSMATNASMRSGLSGPVLLAHAARDPLCLDEDPPTDLPATPAMRIGGALQAPKVIKRVEPRFPASARKSMGNNRNVLVVVEALISKSGCVRSLRVLQQSPFPELNGAALMALSRWSFTPGYFEGQPVDVRFNLTMNFKVW
jgi:TonB family protein